ncbi:ATP-dependent carboxylate-amine ligase [Halomicroarcula sp. GCM10025709]|uniref:carboxylate--amine ligase n=1 Tax=Haloarcula TaxID=2237 RepID=UPI0024C46260|nr:hypothetical protein [Halomicroarcula sp. YJ-61-S]
MSDQRPPRVIVLDGDYDNAIQVATELSEDLDATIVGIGSAGNSRLLRSKYCDIGVTADPEADGYGEELLEIIWSHEPDVVLPVGYQSVVTLDGLRDRLPGSIRCCLPPTEPLSTAVDKRATLSLADDCGIDTPDDYTTQVTTLDEQGRPGSIDQLPFPVFLKARHECGETMTAKVDEPAAFWSTYEDLAEEATDDILVQEFIDDPRTFGCGVLYCDGDLKMLFEHEELRSVPRAGGSGTRVRIYRHPALEAATIALLDGLDWNGPALVEFKRRPDGSFVLMEVNPKLWASYALASQSGYRFVSSIVSELLDLPWEPSTCQPAQVGEMVFPLRELYFSYSHESESLLRSIVAMAYPPARIDLNFRDPISWFTPPSGDAEADAEPPVRGSDADTRSAQGGSEENLTVDADDPDIDRETVANGDR